MTKDLNKALDEIELSYGQVVEIANNMLAEYFQPINDLIDEITANINNYSIEHIRSYILRAQLQAYSISEIKEKSALKADIAEAIRKEKYAEAYNGLEGTTAAKDNNATLAISENIVAHCLYELIANLMKTKLDQIHRMVDSLKSILMSRMQEAKLMSFSVTDDVPPAGRTVINE